MARALPDLPQPHRRRRARDASTISSARCRSSVTEVAERHAGVRLDAAARVEHPRRAGSPDPDGKRVVDFADSNLHVLGYSVPVRAACRSPSCATHLFTDPENPDVIPYRTSYYDENWGFCLSHRQLEQLPEGDYEVVIDSSLDGRRTSPTPRRSCRARATTRCSSRPTSATPRSATTTSRASCSPRRSRSTSRPAAAATRYRFLFAPGDDRAALLALAERGAPRPRIAARPCRSRASATRAPFTYKRSRRGDAEIDQRRRQRRACGDERRGSRDFTPLGGDERQFCSPGFDLPVGVLSRTPTDAFPGVPHLCRRPRLRPAGSALGDSFVRYLDVLDVLERNRTLPQPEPERRAAARQARPLPRRRRRLVHRGPAALGAEPLRRRARPAGDRRALGPDLRRGRGRGRRAPRSRAAREDGHGAAA